MLLPQQQSAIARLQQYKVGALFMEPGTGKTRAAVHLINSAPGTTYVLWLTPFQTKQNLLNEIIASGGINNLEIIGIETLSMSDREYLRILNKVQQHNTFIICDESIKIKNNNAIRTRRIINLSQYATYKLILNGTPITQNITDIWAQMEFLSPRILNMPYTQYINTFCETVKVTKRINGKRPTTHEFISKYHNVDYLYSLIRHYIYECNLCLSIDKIHNDITYCLSEEDTEEYNRLKEKYLDDENLKFMNNNIFIEMTQKMQHNYCITEDKIEKLRELLSQTEKQKTLVYTKFIRSRETLQKAFPNLEILTYGKHALGLNLQQYNHTIYFDKTFDYAQMSQSTFRTYRTGQTDNCTYTTLTGNVGLETMIDRNINKKQSLLDYFKQVGVEQIKKEL